MKDTRNGLTFKEWLIQVDKNLEERVEVSHDDMEDFNSWDCWNDEMSPEEGADACMENDTIYNQALEEGF